MLVSCTKCKIKSHGTSKFFGPDKRRPNGFQSQCRKCRNIYKTEDYYKNRDKYLANSEIYRKANKEKIIAYFREFNKSPERIEYLKKHHSDNKNYYSEKHREWRINNLEQRATDAAKRRLAEKKATPDWLSKEQKKEMRDIYNEAKELSWLSEDGLAVDHIIPIKGKNVSGLHVPWNLRIIPYKENASKGNKLIPEAF